MEEEHWFLVVDNVKYICAVICFVEDTLGILLFTCKCFVFG